MTNAELEQLLHLRANAEEALRELGRTGIFLTAAQVLEDAKMFDSVACGLAGLGSFTSVAAASALGMDDDLDRAAVAMGAFPTTLAEAAAIGIPDMGALPTGLAESAARLTRDAEELVRTSGLGSLSTTGLGEMAAGLARDAEEMDRALGLSSERLLRQMEESEALSRANEIDKYGREFRDLVLTMSEAPLTVPFEPRLNFDPTLLRRCDCAHEEPKPSRKRGMRRQAGFHAGKRPPKITDNDWNPGKIGF